MEQEMPTTQIEAMPPKEKAEDIPRTVAHKSKRFVADPNVDPLTDHLTALLIPATVLGILFVGADYATFYSLVETIGYIALILIATLLGVQKESTWRTVATSSAIAGFITSGIVEIYQLIEKGKLLLIFTTIVRPLFAAAIIGLASGFIYLLVLLVLQYKQRNKHS